MEQCLDVPPGCITSKRIFLALLEIVRIQRLNHVTFAVVIKIDYVVC